MLEIFAPGVIYNAAKDLLKFGLGFRRRQFSPEERLARVDKWKPLFEKELLRRHQAGLRTDIIIRDVRRIDEYPDTDTKEKGISAWFRLGLIDTYHRGILVAMHWQRLVEVSEGGYRTAKPSEYENGNDPGIKVVLAARIPYYLIESVDLEGDEYYGFPHIFCHFLLKGQPYESIQFYQERRIAHFDSPFYTEIGDYEAIRRESFKVGNRYV